jgi:hypothetical protein
LLFCSTEATSGYSSHAEPLSFFLFNDNLCLGLVPEPPGQVSQTREPAPPLAHSLQSRGRPLFSLRRHHPPVLTPPPSSSSRPPRPPTSFGKQPPGPVQQQPWTDFPTVLPWGRVLGLVDLHVHADLAIDVPASAVEAGLQQTAVGEAAASRLSSTCGAQVSGAQQQLSSRRH